MAYDLKEKNFVIIPGWKFCRNCLAHYRNSKDGSESCSSNSCDMALENYEDKTVKKQKLDEAFGMFRDITIMIAIFVLDGFCSAKKLSHLLFFNIILTPKTPICRFMKSYFSVFLHNYLFMKLS